MKRAILERNIAAVLFVLVLIVFSFAERDSKKLDRLYIKTGKSLSPLKVEKTFATDEAIKPAFPIRFVRN
jgi:hypothetical protein